MRRLLLLCCLTTVLVADAPAHILIKIRQGLVSQGIAQYRAWVKESGKQDMQRLAQIGAAIIEAAAKTEDVEAKGAALWAAAFSQDPRFLPLLSSAIEDPNPTIQLMGLYFLSLFPDDRATDIMRQGLSSPWMEIRLQTASALLQRKDPRVLAQIERWMDELPPQLRFILVPFFAGNDDRFATSWMRKFLRDPDPLVRHVALTEAIRCERDDLLPEIREAARTGSIEAQELAAFGLGQLNDSGSVPLLQEKAKSPNPFLRMAASYALWKLGTLDAAAPILALAKQSNPFAIALLGQMRQQLDVLKQLAQSPFLDTRVNASLALAAAKDASSIPGVLELLSPAKQNLMILQTTSPGGALKAWATAAQVNAKADPFFFLKGIKSQQQIIADLYELPPRDFLIFARQALLLNNKEATQTTIQYVSQLHNDEARTLLQEQLGRPGAPIARTFATLALYQNDQEGPYGACVRNWLIEMQRLSMVQVAKPTLKTDKESFFDMTRLESSQLLLAALDTLAVKHDTQAIDAILIALETGNPVNRPILASLLLRLSE